MHEGYIFRKNLSGFWLMYKGTYTKSVEKSYFNIPCPYNDGSNIDSRKLVMLH